MQLHTQLGEIVTNLDLLFGGGELRPMGRGSRSGTTMLVYGPPGALKTSLLLSFARGAARLRKTAIFITLAQEAESVKAQLDSFNWREQDALDGCPWDFEIVRDTEPDDFFKFVDGKKEEESGLLLGWAIDEQFSHDITKFRELCDTTLTSLAHRRDVEVIAIDGINHIRFGEPASPPRTSQPESRSRSTMDADVQVQPGSLQLSAELSQILRLRELGAMVCVSAESSSGDNPNSLRSRILDELRYQVSIVCSLGAVDTQSGSSRTIRFEKARAQAVVGGEHELTIDGDGLHVWPNPESWRFWHRYSFSDIAPQDAQCEPDSIQLFDSKDGLPAIRQNDRTFLRGPEGTHKHSIALRFLDCRLWHKCRRDPGHSTCQEREGECRGWVLNLGWGPQHASSHPCHLRHVPPISSTLSPARLFHEIVGSAREFLMGWHPKNGVRPRAVVVDPHVLKHNGLTEYAIHRFVDSLVGLLSQLGYHVLVVENADVPDHFLDSIFDNLFVTVLRPHLPSGRQFPWFHPRRLVGSTHDSEAYFRCYASGDEPGVRLVRDENISHGGEQVTIPELELHLHAETAPQSAFVDRVDSWLNQLALIDAFDPKVKAYDPVAADMIRQGLESYAYLSHLNRCLVESFDEAWISRLMRSDDSLSGEFCAIELQGDNLPYPRRALERVSVPGSQTSFVGLPLLLNVMVIAADRKFLARGLRQAPVPGSPDDTGFWEHLTEPQVSIWRELVSRCQGQEDKIVESLDRLCSVGWDERKTGGPLTLAQWAYGVRLAASLLKEPPQRELFRLTTLRDETLVCFLLGYLCDQLVDSSEIPIRWLEGPTDDLQRGVYERLLELHYILCLTRFQRVRYEDRREQQDAADAKHAPQDVTEVKQELPVPLRAEWYTTYRAQFGKTLQSSDWRHYRLVRPRDVRLFSGDWYLGVRQGSVAKSLGIDIVKNLTSANSVRWSMLLDGVGIVPSRERFYDPTAAETEVESSMDIAYRFDVPARYLWEDALSRLDFANYADVRDGLAERFERLFALLLGSARMFRQDASAVPSYASACSHIEQTCGKELRGQINQLLFLLSYAA